MSRMQSVNDQRASAPLHPIFDTPTIPTTGVEDVNGWAFKRARTCEATLSFEEVVDAASEGVDVRALKVVCQHGFAKFNGRWFAPDHATTVASGLEPNADPGNFEDLDDAECAALERVREHWRIQAEAGR